MKSMIPVAEKATSFYKTYNRKENLKEVTHYCSGCGHGIIHKLIASAIDELKIQDKTIFLSPVGCAVFAYYYFDTGNIQCSHGRAPAVATGLKRALKDSVVISYQGDGDLAAIGIAEIIHAANRGELFTVIFVNNGTYGMTGGQMAPTTALGQKTLTSPNGRSLDNDGQPIDMCKIIDSLKEVAFIQRCSVSNSKEILKTKQAIKKALENQINKVGFSFVEILSPCPTNWKLSTLESRNYIDETLTKIFDLKIFRDKKTKVKTKETPLLENLELYNLLKGDSLKSKNQQKLKLIDEKKIIISGFGGQGILFAAKLLATCALIEDREITYLPSYGPEMRGGKAKVDIIISSSQIGSPLIDQCDYLLAFSQTGFDSYVSKTKKGGLVITNSSLFSEKQTKSRDFKTVNLAATEIAKSFEMIKSTNIVMVTALIVKTKLFLEETLKEALTLIFKQEERLIKNNKLVEETIKMLYQDQIGKLKLLTGT